MKESTADVPILAHKRYRLAWRPGGHFYLAHTRPTPFGNIVQLDEHAVCVAFFTSTRDKKHPNDTAPDPTCTCGFYAVPDTRTLTDDFGNIELDVELSGRVIIHEFGYRAQRQRVLRVYPPRCYYCGANTTDVWLADLQRPDMTTTTGTFAVHRYTETRPLCANHAFRARDEVIVPIDRVMDSIGLPWTPAC